MLERFQLDAFSLVGLLTALIILGVLVGFAASPHFGSRIHDEQYSSAMRGESNGETGLDNRVVPSDEI